MEEENILSQLIDNVTNAWEEAQSNRIGELPPELENTIQGLVMGTMGGGGVGKGLRQLVLAMKGKIKGGKMIPSQPIRRGIVGKTTKGTPKEEGWYDSEIMGGKNPFWGKYGKGKFSEFKELADEYDNIGLSVPERADEIYSIFQKQFGNKNAAKVLDILLKQLDK